MRTTTFLIAALTSATAQAQQATQQATQPAAPETPSLPFTSETLRGSSWFERVTAQIERSEYDFQASADTCEAWSAPNRSQSLRTRLSSTGLEVVPRQFEGTDAPWTLTVETRRFGRTGQARELVPADVEATGVRVELDHGPLTEWFVNRPGGIEQGWTIDESPAGDGPLAIELDVGGGFRLALDADALGGEFVHDDVALPYRGLVAFDAEGRALATRLESTADGFRIVVDDAEATYPVTVDPVLEGSVWIVESNQAGASAAFSVAAIGDVNGDGYDDVAVGAYLYDGGQADEGRVWVFHGSSSGLSNTSNWFIESNQAESWCGYQVAGAGDVNRDGYDDLLVSAPRFDSGQTDEGVVWAFHGSASGLSTGSSWFSDGDQTGASYGLAIAAAGDVNSDGYDDVVIGAPLYDEGETNEGKAWVYHGSPSGLPTVANWSKTSDQSNARFGGALAGAGDVNGDGYDDIIVAAPGFDGPEVNEGRVWRFNGSINGTLQGSNWLGECDQAGASFGTALAIVGDINGDGYDDVVVGAPYFDTGAINGGRAWLFHGGHNPPQGSDWFGQTNQIAALYGQAIAGAGDVNGDGYDDVLIAAPGYDNPEIDEGRVSLYLGSPPGLIPFAFWIGDGNQADANFGRALAGGGDFNGDGFDDVVIGAPGHDNGGIDEGRAYQYRGSPELGANYCTSTNNSTGGAAQIRALFSPSVSAGNLQLEASPVPNGFGLFIHAGSPGQTVLGHGFLCVSGTFVRGPIVTASHNVSRMTYDNSSNAYSLTAFAGSTRHFQAWFRDVPVGGIGFNLSNGISVPIWH